MKKLLLISLLSIATVSLCAMKKTRIPTPHRDIKDKHDVTGEITDFIATKSNLPSEENGLPAQPTLFQRIWLAAQKAASNK